MSEVKLPEGYKQTEVGVIPEDWEVKELSQIVELKSGETITSKNISSDDFFPCYGGNGLRGYTSTFNRNGEHVLIGRQGALCGNIEYVNNKFFASEHALVVTTIKNYSYKWLAYVLDRMHLNQYSESSAQPGLSAIKLKKLKVSLPPKQEQTAIATALSDVDNLIQSLEKLIAKKEAIKTGTMQQLLTGKTRLPEFATREDGSPKGFKQTELGRIPEDWKVGTLSELSSYINDGTHYTPSYVQNGVPFYSVENVTANDFINVKNISLEEHNRLIKRCKPERGDILMTRIGSLGKTRIIDWDVDASIYVSLALIKPSNTIKSQYMYEFSKSNLFQKEVEKRSLVNATPQKINMAEIGQVQICYPKNKNEQTAIATTLSDMDTEIQALQQRLEKTKDIKQGMMQQLLTGKVRLAY